MKRTPNHRINHFLKSYCLPLAAVLVLNSCQKTTNTEDNARPASPDETLIPASNPVTTSVSAYFGENLLAREGVNVYINQNLTAYSNSTYNAASFTGDAYSNVLKTERNALSNSFFALERIVPLTKSKRNYLEVCSKVNRTSINILYTAAGVANLPGGGRLTYGANNFGYNGGAQNGFGEAGYADPNANGFSLKVPSLHTDVDNKRWFLKNYGTYYIELPKPIDASSDVRLITRIPANLVATAPDSVETWVYGNKVWIKKGYAKKSGTEYEKRIDGSGIWAFATAVKGIYTTLKVRSSTGQPVINGMVLLKNSLQQEVAGVRTDMDGNAVCFVPTGEALTAHVFNKYWYIPTSPIYSQSLAPLTAAGETTVTVPVTNALLTTMKGSAKDCNGVDIQNGSLLVKETNGEVRAHLPITNGNYAGSFVSAGSGEVFLLNILNDATGQSGSDTAASLKTGMELTVNVNTCAPATNLYANYSITDGGPVTTITGDAASPVAPSLYATPYSYQTSFIVSSGNTGFEFTSNITTTGTYTGSGISGLWVNKVYYSYSPGNPMRITITRYDLLPRGYIEGAADFYYYEGPTLRHFVANFRLQRLT